MGGGAGGCGGGECAIRSNDENTRVHLRRDAVVENVHDEPTLSLCKIMPEDALDTPATQASQSRKPTIRLLLFGAIFTPVDEEKYDFSLQAPRSRRDRAEIDEEKCDAGPPQTLISLRRRTSSSAARSTGARTRCAR